MKDAEVLIYKETPEGDRLETHVFFPRGGGKADRAAILFFFSSAWDSGTVTQFAPQCMHFAERGMVAFAFDYRVSSRHATGPLEAMADARTAIRWVRANAKHFGVDGHRIVCAGGSGGAQMVAMAALRDGDGESENDDDLQVSCAPDAMVFFSPMLDISKRGSGLDHFADAKAARAASPVHLFKSQPLPPTLMFHSKGDRRVPIEGTRKFAQLMKRRKRPCRLVEYDGVDHSFFNFNVDSRLFEATIDAADAFLVEEGFLEA
ncbi:MAG: alpha/beta hydrolase [Verrucomicrobiales bacterium]